MAKHEWVYLGEPHKDGQRYWWSKAEGRISLADHSGDGHRTKGTPEETDDGILWLDASRPVHVRLEGVSVPVIDPENRQSICADGIPAIPFLAAADQRFVFDKNAADWFKCMETAVLYRRYVNSSDDPFHGTEALANRVREIQIDWTERSGEV